MGHRLNSFSGLLTLFLQLLLASHGSCFRFLGFNWTTSYDDILEPQFHTEPLFLPEKVQLEHLNGGQDRLGDGYIFSAMMLKRNSTWGPRIYDTKGNLIWFGLAYTYYRAQDFKPCIYNTSNLTHLCWSEREANPAGGHPLSHKIIADNTYQVIHNVTTRGNGHEFRPVNRGDTFLTMDYKHRPFDLRPFYGQQDGWIEDACILEYRVKRTEIVFEWCYSDHLPLSESTLYFRHPNQTEPTARKVGNGTRENPWDFGHMNSLDKNSEGDYLASLRHTDQVLKIAGPNSASGKPPGTILWRLGGKSNDFHKAFSFNKQHDARYVSTNTSETIITLFNNAWEGVTEPAQMASSGQLIAINNATMTARLIQQFVHPHGKTSPSRGSMQILENGNVFIGWGQDPEMTEFAPDATPLYHARYAINDPGQFSYRIFKYPWVGRPLEPPKLVAYSHACLASKYPSPMYAYVSWNGATEVRKWRVDTAWHVTGPWIPAGVYDKESFETQMKLPSWGLYVRAEALDANGTVLGSTVQQTFVPQLYMKSKCGLEGCPPGTIYRFADSRAESCSPIYRPSIVPMFVLLACIELIIYCYTHLGVWTADLSLGLPSAFAAEKLESGEAVDQHITDTKSESV